MGSKHMGWGSRERRSGLRGPEQLIVSKRCGWCDIGSERRSVASWQERRAGHARAGLPQGNHAPSMIGADAGWRHGTPCRIVRGRKYQTPGGHNPATGCAPPQRRAASPLRGRTLLSRWAVPNFRSGPRRLGDSTAGSMASYCPGPTAAAVQHGSTAVRRSSTAVTRRTVSAGVCKHAVGAPGWHELMRHLHNHPTCTA